MIFFARDAAYDTMGSMTVPIPIEPDGSYHFGPENSLGWVGEFWAFPREDHWTLEEVLNSPTGVIYYAKKDLFQPVWTCPSINIDTNFKLDRINPPNGESHTNRIELRKLL